MGSSVSTGYWDGSALASFSLESPSDDVTAVLSPDVRVAVGESDVIGDMGGDVEANLKKDMRRDGDIGEVGVDGCFGFTRAVFACVHASRRALKQARPEFHDSSSRISLRRLARLA